MSSLQKFHRRTNNAPSVKPIGMESVPAGAGFYLGFAGDGTSYMYVAPKSTEASLAWGSPNTTRGTISTTNGLANTDTLAGFGQAAHPAAFYCKNLTTGGYNTWYLPASNDLNTMYTNRNATPFASTNSFLGEYYWSSSEATGSYARYKSFLGGNNEYVSSKNSSYYVRAVRRSVI